MRFMIKDLLKAKREEVVSRMKEYGKRGISEAEKIPIEG